MIEKAVPKQYSTNWKEVYAGGSQDAEARLFATFSDRIKGVQEQIKKHEHAPFLRRAFHAKIHTGITDHASIANAQFRVLPDIQEDLRIGFFQPSTTYKATVRLSSASGAIQPDATPDLRGVALRVVTGQETFHDFLMTDAPASHARDAWQFMIAAEAVASRWMIVSLVKLLLGLGLSETIRMVGALQRDARKIDSLATDQFWSRAPYKFGPYAVKFTLQPSSSTPDGSTPSGESYLKEEFTQRLLKGPITFDFRVQRYVDEITTPIEDGTVEWKEFDTPFETIAQLVIPQQDLRTDAAQEEGALVDNLEFNPWNTTDDFRPLGNLNRARRIVYQASANYRSGRTDNPPSSLVSLGSKVVGVVLVGVALIAGMRYVSKRHIFPSVLLVRERQTVVDVGHPDHIGGPERLASTKPIFDVAPPCTIVSLFMRSGALLAQDPLVAKSTPPSNGLFHEACPRARENSYIKPFMLTWKKVEQS